MTMKRICPFLLLAASLAAGCASRKPLVHTSAVSMRKDSLNLTVESLSTATLHDITVIPADSMGDIVHIGYLELDKRTHTETSAISSEETAATVRESAPPSSGDFKWKLIPVILILLALLAFLLRK